MNKKITPQSSERTSVCPVHGEYTERGYSFFADTATRWGGCHECNRELRERDEAAAHARREQERQQRIEHRMNAASIPLALRGKSFDDYEIESEEMEHAHGAVREFAENFWSRHMKAGTFLVLIGPNGTGKGHLSVAAAQHVLQRGTAMYITTADLIDQVRSTWRKNSPVSESEMVRTLGFDIDLLVLDEVGLQNGTENEQVILSKVLDRRYRDLRPTILITNSSGSELREFVGTRIFDRLRERAVFIPFTWESYRGRV